MAILVLRKFVNFVFVNLYCVNLLVDKLYDFGSVVSILLYLKNARASHLIIMLHV